MLPPNKEGRVCREKEESRERLRSFSSIELDAGSELRGTKMRSLGYEIDVKKNMGEFVIMRDLCLDVYYDFANLKNYIYLSNFLNLCGFVVNGYLVQEEISTTTEKNNFGIILADDIKDCFLHTIKIESKNNDVIQQLLNLIEKQQLLDHETSKAMLTIFDIFKKNLLWIHMYNDKYFFYDIELMKTVCNSYVKAETELHELYKKTDKKTILANHILFARCFLASRVVIVYNRCNLGSFYDASLIKRAIQDLIQKEKFLTLSNFLLAEMCRNEDKTRDSIRYYNECLSLLKGKNHSFASVIWYYKGKINEKIGEVFNDAKTIDNAIKCYLKAYESDSHNFSAYYKILMNDEIKGGHYAYVENEYLKLLDKYKFIYENNFAQPEDLENLFKLYFRLGRLCSRRLNDKRQALYYFQEAEKLGKTDIVQMSFLEEFYGSDAEKYLSTIRNRLPMSQIRINIEDCEWDLA